MGAYLARPVSMPVRSRHTTAWASAPASGPVSSTCTWQATSHMATASISRQYSASSSP